jgi:hypothetical protein
VWTSVRDGGSGSGARRGPHSTLVLADLGGAFGDSASVTQHIFPSMILVVFMQIANTASKAQRVVRVCVIDLCQLSHD